MTENKQEQRGFRGAVGKVQQKLGGMAGKVRAGTVTSADEFVERAARGDMYEIEAAKLALSRASSPDVKEVAQRIIETHTTSTHQLGAALEMNETKGVAAPPKDLDARHKTMIKNLQSVPTDGFDATYVDQQVLAHDETLTLLTHYGDGGDNVQLRAYAEGAAPVVERHLRRAKELRMQLAH